MSSAPLGVLARLVGGDLVGVLDLRGRHVYGIEWGEESMSASEVRSDQPPGGGEDWPPSSTRSFEHSASSFAHSGYELGFAFRGHRHTVYPDSRGER